VQALQHNKDKGLAPPEGGHPGRKIIVPAPLTLPAAEVRVKDQSVKVTDWYFGKRAA